MYLSAPASTFQGKKGTKFDMLDIFCSNCEGLKF